MNRILMVDNHEIVRDGLKRILSEQGTTQAFGEASNTADGLKLAQEQDWDIAILDLTLDDRGGLDLLRELKLVRPRLPVLILTTHSEEQYARRAFKGGAAGYVTKSSPSAELLKAIDKVIGGGKYVSSTLAESLIVDLEKGSDRPAHENLSDREFEVMRLIASGKTVMQIAGILNLSDKTISTYRARILEKMDMKTSAELTHYAFCNDLVNM